MKVLIGTNNLHKLNEFKEIFEENALEFEILSLHDMPFVVPDPIEDGNSFYDNALIKAKYFYEKYKVPCISDDSGLVVEALNGMPGIYSARYASLHGLENTSICNRRLLLENMKNEKNRNAYFECCLVYYDGKKVISSTGRIKGIIAYDEKGNNGFGYDPLFVLLEHNKTIGEIDEKIKNKLSHRYNAILEFIEKYKNYKN